LSVIDPPRVREISAALQDEDAEVRLLAAQCLGDLRARSEADSIAALLDDRSGLVAFGAAVALAGLGDRRGAPTLRDSLGRPDRAFAAAIGLGDLADRESQAALRRLAKHRWRSPILRAAAARALVRLGDPEGAQVIRRFVRSWRIEARQYAVELVGELGLVSLVPDLARAYRRSKKTEHAVYERTLEQLSNESSEARALLASIRDGAHPV
jgi:HEAT repeat protein